MKQVVVLVSKTGFSISNSNVREYEDIDTILNNKYTGNALKHRSLEICINDVYEIIIHYDVIHGVVSHCVYGNRNTLVSTQELAYNKKNQLSKIIIEFVDEPIITD